MKGVIEVRLSDLDGVNVRLPLDVDVIGQMQQWMVEESCQHPLPPHQTPLL